MCVCVCVSQAKIRHISLIRMVPACKFIDLIGPLDLIYFLGNDVCSICVVVSDE